MKIVFLTHHTHRKLGWVTDDDATACLMAALRRGGLEVSIHEIASRAEVETLLYSATSNTLFWGNAYELPSGDEAPPFWLADLLEESGVPYIGSGPDTLQVLIDKDTCQARLGTAGLPIPRHVAIDEASFAERALAPAEERITMAGLTPPYFVKPTATAGSVGIDLDSIQETAAGAARCCRRLIERFGGRALVEEYLPGPELTIGVIRYREASFVTATRVETRTGVPFITEENRRREFERGLTTMVPLDPTPYTALALQVCDALGIRDITRMDCRFDAAGTLRVFDVNGMPGLSPIHSSSVQQLYAYHPTVERDELHQRLALSVVASAAERNGLEIPESTMAQRLEALVEPFEVVA